MGHIVYTHMKNHITEHLSDESFSIVRVKSKSAFGGGPGGSVFNDGEGYGLILSPTDLLRFLLPLSSLFFFVKFQLIRAGGSNEKLLGRLGSMLSL
mmetsp:Transcript_13466/g.16035  ORF Transcript_13466/g.16035 Transcript_13466/m.16035 type:complete len:96 (+) Transcript_13466:307-594(+)